MTDAETTSGSGEVLYLLGHSYRSGQRFDHFDRRFYFSESAAIEAAKGSPRLDDCPGAHRADVWKLILPSERRPEGYLHKLVSYQRKVGGEIEKVFQSGKLETDDG